MLYQAEGSSGKREVPTRQVVIYCPDPHIPWGDKGDPMFLASIESLIGSTWAAVATFAIGYVAGHLVPIGKIASWIPGKRD
jgi:hypothetical protein